MTDSAALTAYDHGVLAPEQFVARLRAQGTRYHNLHPFHQRMDAGELTRDELQRWVSNRFYYQKCIPLKDAAILANCPEVEVRREWIQRIVDHDGTAAGTGGHRVMAATGRGARRIERRAHVGGARPPRRAVRRRRVRELCAPAALGRGGRVIAHGAVRAGRDSRPARSAANGTTTGSTRLDSSTSARGSCRPHATRSTRST